MPIPGFKGLEVNKVWYDEASTFNSLSLQEIAMASVPKNSPIEIAEMIQRGRTYFELPRDYREMISYPQHERIKDELKALFKYNFDQNFDQEKTSQNVPFDPNLPFSKKTTKYTSIPIPAVPTQILVQFIGGPFNAEQRYYDRLKTPWLKDREIIRFPDEPKAAEIVFDGDNLKATEITVDHYNYLMQFLPQDQTQNFTDTQVAIAIFQ